MSKILVTILLALPLVSFAPVPAAPARTKNEERRTMISVPSFVVRRSSFVVRAQPCTWETAPARLSQEIEDPIGYPFGRVEAWSCSGDSQAVIAELQTRASAMQSESAIYRAAHPIGGVTP